MGWDIGQEADALPDHIATLRKILDNPLRT